MAISFAERTYRLKSISDILGTQPADENLHSRFILSKCPEDVEEDKNKIKTYAEEEAKSLTVFSVGEDDAPVLPAYHVQGFFKEALNNLKDQNTIGQPRKKVDNFLFVDPDLIYFYRDNKMIMEPDNVRERPLRTEYMGSELSALASSERILDPWEIEFTVRLIANGKEGSRSKYSPLTWDAIEDALSYGACKGLGQWRNAGNGRFTWERLQ